MAERLTLLPRPRGSLPEERKRGEKVDLTDWIAPQFLIDILEAAKLPGRAAAGEEIGPAEAMNFALNMGGGGLATSGSAPANALGAFSRGQSVGGIPIRELLFPGRGDLTAAEKKVVTSFTKSLSNQAVSRREEMRAGGETIATPTPGLNMIREIAFNPEKLVDKRLVPVFGDTSRIGQDVSQIRGVPLSKPVTQQGGDRYPLVKSNIKEGVPFASEPGAAASKIANLNMYPDDNVLGVFLAGGPRSIDFSHHQAQALVRQLDAIRPSATAVKSFDTALRNFKVPKTLPDGKKVVTTPFKNLKTSITSPDMEVLMAERMTKDFSPGQLRTAISQLMFKKGFQKQGFPVYDDALQVMTDPRLQQGYMGQMMFESAPGRGIVTPSYTHQSYSAGIPGKYVGGIKGKTGEMTGVPAELLFPKLFAEKRAQGKTDANILTSMLKSHQGEKFTEQDLQPLMRFLER